MTATHPVEAALLADVLADPADDAVRLIYADWLETEGGDAARAEFIRVQCELSRLSEPDGGPFGCKECRSLRRACHWHALWRRGERLLDAASAAGGFNHGLPPFARFWRRGFVELVSLTLAEFTAHAEATFRAQPVTRVTLTDVLAGRVQADGSWTAIIPSATPHPCPLFPRRRGSWRYATKAACERALAKRYVAYGRSLAGLPPL